MNISPRVLLAIVYCTFMLQLWPIWVCLNGSVYQSTYLIIPLLLWEHRPSMMHLHCLLSLRAFCSSSPQECPCMDFMSSIKSHRQLFLGLPLFHFPCGFQDRPCLVIGLSEGVTKNVPPPIAWKGEIMTANGWKCALHILFKTKRT
jgi:hypothetical protein